MAQPFPATPHFVAQPIWLCSYDPARVGNPAPRRTEASKNAENVLTSATIARPSRKVIASSSEVPTRTVRRVQIISFAVCCPVKQPLWLKDA